MNKKVIFERHAFFAESCLNKHSFGLPFEKTIKEFFRLNKKFGSKDRRRIKALCYAWFRIGYSFTNLEKQQQLILGYLVVDQQIEPHMLEALKYPRLPKEWEGYNLKTKIEYLSEEMNWSFEQMFPDTQNISSSIDLESFLYHSLKQPKLWIRPLTNYANELFAADTNAVRHASGAIGLDIGVNQTLEKYKNQFEIQDLSCQLTYNKIDVHNGCYLWDCCCASGGKSLHVLNSLNTVTIYASDKRKSVFKEFNKRTRRFSKQISTAVVDLETETNEIAFVNNETIHKVRPPFFDVIIADVPCTGSGTWNRNPEFKAGFVHNQNEFQQKQLTIVANVWEFLKPGGVLFYSTCSVYEEENEGVVNQLPFDNYTILETGYVRGYENDSDTMFFAKIKKI